jgi:hypothetical protein
MRIDGNSSSSTAIETHVRDREETFTVAYAAAQLGDGVDRKPAAGGTTTVECPEGKHPQVENKGHRAVSVSCVDDTDKGKGKEPEKKPERRRATLPRPDPEAPIID